MERLDILAEGRPVGTAEVTEEGLYLRFTADCEDPLSGPCRLVGAGERGELRLGVPEPEGGRLRLSRVLSRRDCAAVGRLSHLELRAPAGSAPQWGPLPPDAFRGSWLRNRLGREREVLFARQGETRLAALPFDLRKPFPWPELFCLARIAVWQGREWAVFAFDGQERPILPGKWERKRKNGIPFFRKPW